MQREDTLRLFHTLIGPQRANPPSRLPENFAATGQANTTFLSVEHSACELAWLELEQNHLPNYFSCLLRPMWPQIASTRHSLDDSRARKLLTLHAYPSLDILPFATWRPPTQLTFLLRIHHFIISFFLPCCRPVDIEPDDETSNTDDFVVAAHYDDVVTLVCKLALLTPGQYNVSKAESTHYIASFKTINIQTFARHDHSRH